MGWGDSLQSYNVPCGNCPECSRNKINSWVFRIQQELKTAINPLFTLITYDNENQPFINNTPTLCKRDIQLWLKRLRKEYAKFSDKQIRYYLVGEYGSKTHRPHYHAIIMNVEPVYVYLLEKTWSMGFLNPRPLLSTDGVFYTLKYISKPKSNHTSEIQKEFSLMSKNLGSNYITYSTKRHHQHIENSYVILNDYKIPLPRYYKNKFLSSEQIAQLTKRMQLLSDAKKEKLLQTIQNKYPHNTEQINQRNLELSKLNTKFDKRNETI